MSKNNEFSGIALLLGGGLKLADGLIMKILRKSQVVLFLLFDTVVEIEQNLGTEILDTSSCRISRNFPHKNF